MILRHTDREVHPVNKAPETSFAATKTLNIDPLPLRAKNPNYRTRLERKAKALLNRQGDRPLRNQQQRLISRWQRNKGVIK